MRLSTKALKRSIFVIEAENQLARASFSIYRETQATRRSTGHKYITAGFRSLKRTDFLAEVIADITTTGLPPVMVIHVHGNPYNSIHFPGATSDAQPNLGLPMPLGVRVQQDLYRYYVPATEYVRPHPPETEEDLDNEGGDSDNDETGEIKTDAAIGDGSGGSPSRIPDHTCDKDSDEDIKTASLRQPSISRKSGLNSPMWVRLDFDSMVFTLPRTNLVDYDMGCSSIDSTPDKGFIDLNNSHWTANGMVTPTQLSQSQADEVELIMKCYSDCDFEKLRANEDS